MQKKNAPYVCQTYTHSSARMHANLTYGPQVYNIKQNAASKVQASKQILYMLNVIYQISPHALTLAHFTQPTPSPINKTHTLTSIALKSRSAMEFLYKK